MSNARLRFQLIRDIFTEMTRLRCDLSAAALTYYTLLAIVPTLAIAFGIAQTVGVEFYLKDQISLLLRDHQKVADMIVDFAERALARTRGDFVAYFGLVFLIWSSGSLLYTVEKIMNQIWKAPRMRRWWKMALVYLSVIFAAPLILAAASLLSITWKQLFIDEASKAMPPIDSLFYRSTITALAFFCSWMLCSFWLKIMPNYRVPLKSALTAGAISGLLFQLLQWGYFYLQQQLTSYSVIYGSFAALPLFLLWLQASWSILMFGGVLSAELAKKTT